MIGTIDVAVEAKSPNLPLFPVRAFVGSPSSIRVRNVPKRVGDWNINKVYLTVVYPDGTIKQADCVQTGGVWVGTVEGTATSGTCENGYTVFADGTDENGNSVTGYVLGKGDVEILEADGTMSPDPARYYVKLLSAEAAEPREGDMYPTEGGYVIWQNGQANLLGTPFDQITSYVESAVSAKADLSALDDYAKTDELSSKADLSALNVKRDLTDLNYVRAVDYNHPERIVGFQEGITYYTMFEKVSDTLYKWHNSTWNGQSSNDYHIELSLENPAEPIFSYYRGNGELITSFTIPNGATSFSWEQIELLSEDTIALKNDFISQFRNDCGYLTKTDVIPADGQYQGYADKARTTAGIGASYPTNDPVVVPALADFSHMDALWDNTTGTIVRAYTYARYPWVLSMLNGTTFDPPILLNWGYWYIQRRIGSRLRTVWRGLGWMSDFVDGVAYLIGNTNNDGSTVDLHLTTLNGTTITGTYSSKAITLNQYETSIETYDGQPNSITCTRSTTNIGQKFVKYVAYTDDLSVKADLSAIPTKTSELSNDSGFVEQNGVAVINSLTCDQLVANQAYIVGYATTSDLSAKRGLMDMTVKGVPQNSNSQSWFTIKYGTTTENAWYYDEGRWETGQTLRVLAVPSSIYTLQKMVQEQWTDVGEFTLDSNSEATITYEGVTYSITGYIGDLVVSNELNTRLAALEARIAALEGN